MFKKLFLKILICVFLMTSQSAFAQFLDAEEVSDEIFLITGEVRVLEVYSPKRVSVRNPEVADVDSVSNDEIILVAKMAGSTNLTVWDREGSKIFYITVYSQDPDALKKKLARAVNERLGVEEVYFRKNDVTGKVMVIGEVTVIEKEQIDLILEPFAESIDNLVVVGEATQMVEVDCHILELTKSLSEVFGINWTGTSGSSPTSLTTLSAPAITGQFEDVFRITDITRAALSSQIMAAVDKGKGKILAKPKLMCLSGQEASFLVGGEVPIVTVTASSSGDTVAEDVEYKEYGVMLNIQPVVLEGDDIKLNITTEVKELSTEGQYVRADDTTIKAFATRSTSTVLRLRPGQSVVISGLFKDKVTKDDISGIPGLIDIPILGALFRSKDYQEDQTELVISLVPRLVNMGSKKNNFKKAKRKTPLAKSLNISPKYLKEETALNQYILKVQKNIFQSLEYPYLAQEAGWQGTIKVKLHLDKEGELLNYKISESSGYLSFDDSVAKVVKSLSPYPPFPFDVEIKDLWIDVPIVYKIN
ncbi:MAG: TonB family protein [Candidatus Omnitrophica bacterium]|nr:TonB family protein [Candidatus Omnitrophota bacterium]